VQGVGFRPFIYGLVSRFGLNGFVRNRTGSVLIEIEGRPDLLDAFVAALTASPPPLARIDGMRSASSLAPRGDLGFSIEPSETGARDAPRLPPEVATCADCLAELLDPDGRRYRHPFVNCTNCGPRFTIVTSAPYDRARTSMAGFAICPACAREYDDPRDRRFHAQPIACPACGPRGERVVTMLAGEQLPRIC
jgi:hydrogenase maturation protein HypF